MSYFTFSGTGPIKGFASTLVIGIITSLFSAVLVSRLIYEWLLKKNLNLKFSAPYTQNFMQNMKIDFVGTQEVRIYLLNLTHITKRGCTVHQRP